MHRLTVRILDISNLFQNTNVTIHEIVCVSPPTYYLEWFEIFTPMFLSIEMMVYFFSQFMNGIQGTKPSVWQWNKLLDAVDAIIKYKKTTIYHAI